MKHLKSIQLAFIALLIPLVQETFASVNGCAEITDPCEHKILDEAIVRAAENGNTDLVNELLEQGIDPDSRNSGNMTALMKASSKGYLKLARLLLSYGADPNAQSNSGKTPLIRAVGDGMTKSSDTPRLSIAKSLIKYGADLDRQDNQGNTPLMYSTKRVWTSFLDLLIEEGADVNTLNHKNENALTYILNNLEDPHPMGLKGSRRYYEMLYAKKLIEKGADFNQADLSGETALMKLHKMEAWDLVNLCLSMEQEVQPSEVPELPTSNEVEQLNWQETLTREAFSLEIAQKMLEKGFSVADITEITGLPKSEVTRLQ